MAENNHKWLKWVIAVALFSLICFVIIKIRIKAESFSLDQIDTLKCGYALNTSIYDQNGLPEGMNYELLTEYSRHINKTLSFETIPSDSAWTALMRGDFNLLIYDSGNPAPEEFCEEISFSKPIKDSIVWAVPKGHVQLMDSINGWLPTKMESDDFAQLISKYYRSYRVERYLNNGTMMKYLSPYDDLVQKYCNQYQLDWMLATSLIYQESRFHITAQSHKEAMGLMQITERTAKRFNVDDPVSPEQNIGAGVRYLKFLQDTFSSEEISNDNLVKISLAAYNAGEGRISSVQSIADSLGLDRNSWEDVKLAMDAMPKFSGKETVNFVDNIMTRYEQYLNASKIE